MAEELAVLEGECAAVASALESAALGGPGTEPHEEMFVKITPSALETPASNIDAAQRSYCTLSAGLFDRFSVFEPTAALLPVVEVLDWFAWFGEQSSIRLSLVGEPGAEMASQLRLANGQSKVAVACTAEPALLAEIELSLPTRFDGRVFLDTNGDPVPTRIETTAAELSRLVTAVERCDGPDRYPLTVTAGEINFGVTGEGTQIDGQLAATVDGPGFARQYGPGFGHIVRAIEGDVTLWTGPDEPLALVADQSDVTFRHVVRAV